MAAALEDERRDEPSIRRFNAQREIVVAPSKG
jgi:hypothetical protein